MECSFVAEKKKTSIKIRQSFQIYALRKLVNVPWNVRNDNIHNYIKMDIVHEEMCHGNNAVLQMLGNK